MRVHTLGCVHVTGPCTHGQASDRGQGHAAPARRGVHAGARRAQPPTRCLGNGAGAGTWRQRQPPVQLAAPTSARVGCEACATAASRAAARHGRARVAARGNAPTARCIPRARAPRDDRDRDQRCTQSLVGHKPPFAFLPDAECPSGLQMHLVPVSGHEEDIRRAAYAMVHSGLQGTQAQCAALKAQGYNTLQIADRLAITDRAVRLALSALQPRLESAERIRWGSRFAPL